MIEEKKDENVEGLLEKSLEFVEQGKQRPNVPPPPPLPTPALAALPPPTPLPPRRKYQRRNAFNLPSVEPASKPVSVGFMNWSHERQCVSCSAVIRIAMSMYPRGASSADWEIREAAILEGWEVQLRLSDHLQYTCPRCLLKAA